MKHTQIKMSYKSQFICLSGQYIFKHTIPFIYGFVSGFHNTSFISNTKISGFFFDNSDDSSVIVMNAWQLAMTTNVHRTQSTDKNSKQ